jgi:hypothetical protein
MIHAFGDSTKGDQAPAACWTRNSAIAVISPQGIPF